MASSSEKQKSKILILKSWDEDEFEIEESIAVQSLAIKNMVEDDYTHIPLPNVNTQTLIKIIDYMKNHAEKTTDLNEEQIKTFDNDFVKMNYNELFELVLAANYLNMNGLMDLLCQSVADRMKNKSVKAIRQIFGITNDFTQEEEDNVRSEFAWTHDGPEIDKSLD